MDRRKYNIDATDLGINLTSGEEGEYFKWFLAALLFGKPIQQEIVARAFAEFMKENMTNPKIILEAGWDKLIDILDKGHYVRYDFSTATKLLDVMNQLQEQYDGQITNLLGDSQSLYDIYNRLRKFKGIGPKTAEIFLRPFIVDNEGNK